MWKKTVAVFRYFEAAVPFRLVPALIATAVLVALLLIPTPDGLTPKAWSLVAIFLTTIVTIILKVMPIGVMALMAIVIVSLSQVTSNSSKGAITDALSSFSSPLIKCAANPAVQGRVKSADGKAVLELGFPMESLA